LHNVHSGNKWARLTRGLLWLTHHFCFNIFCVFHEKSFSLALLLLIFFLAFSPQNKGHFSKVQFQWPLFLMYSDFGSSAFLYFFVGYLKHHPTQLLLLMPTAGPSDPLFPTYMSPISSLHLSGPFCHTFFIFQNKFFMPYLRFFLSFKSFTVQSFLWDF